MTDIGIIASIIGVAGAGFRLSLILNAISCEVAQAPIEIHHISKTVTLFSLMLKQTGTTLQSADSVHTRDAIEAAKQIADESTRVFDEVNDMLDRVRSKKEDESCRSSAQQRIKWCFKKNRINYLLGQLESLKLSLSLMMQILQLGKMMAATSKSDLPDVVKDKMAAIQQERAETQNTLIVRYMQMTETEQLFLACEKDRDPVQSQTSEVDAADDDSQLTVTATSLERDDSHIAARLPLLSLGEVDRTMKQIRGSSKDMVRISDQAIDPLLEKWTRWHDVREQKHATHGPGRYAPTVHSMQEDEIQIHEHYGEREDSPRGYYLEGSTTDWRKPNSIQARQEYNRRRKHFAGYQASISAHSSDQEDSPSSNASSKKNTKRHIINSSSDSSDSEIDVKKTKPKVSFQAGPPLDRSTPPRTTMTQSTPPRGQMPSRMPPSPAQSVGSKQPTPPQQTPNPGNRPHATPDQNMNHFHSFSMPFPPIYTHNASNPYASAPPQTPAYYHSPYYNPVGPQAVPSMRGLAPVPNKIQPPTGRPVSKDGKGGHSPSQLSQEMPRDDDWDRERLRDRDRYDRERDRYKEKDRNRDRTRDREYSRHDAKIKEGKSKALREGATKGLLGGLALGSFIEALEGLSI